MRKSVVGGLAEKRIFGRSLLAFTLAATLAFPAASLSFVAQAFADDPSSGDAAEAPTAPGVEPIKRDDIHGIDFMTPAAEDGLWDLFRVENGAGKTIYIEVEKDGTTIAPRFAYAIPETQDTDPEATRLRRRCHLLSHRPNCRAEDCPAGSGGSGRRDPGLGAAIVARRVWRPEQFPYLHSESIRCEARR